MVPVTAYYWIFIYPKTFFHAVRIGIFLLYAIVHIMHIHTCSFKFLCVLLSVSSLIHIGQSSWAKRDSFFARRVQIKQATRWTLDTEQQLLMKPVRVTTEVRTFYGLFCATSINHKLMCIILFQSNPQPLFTLGSISIWCANRTRKHSHRIDVSSLSLLRLLIFIVPLKVSYLKVQFLEHTM